MRRMSYDLYDELGPGKYSCLNNYPHNAGRQQAYANVIYDFMQRETANYTLSGTPYANTNTVSTGVTLAHYDTDIASWAFDDTLAIHLQGYNTSVTRRRINCLRGPHIYRSQNELYIEGVPADPYGYYRVADIEHFDNLWSFSYDANLNSNFAKMQRFWRDTEKYYRKLFFEEYLPFQQSVVLYFGALMTDRPPHRVSMRDLWEECWKGKYTRNVHNYPALRRHLKNLIIYDFRPVRHAGYESSHWTNIKSLPEADTKLLRNNETNWQRILAAAKHFSEYIRRTNYPSGTPPAIRLLGKWWARKYPHYRDVYFKDDKVKSDTADVALTLLNMLACCADTYTWVAKKFSKEYHVNLSKGWTIARNIDKLPTYASLYVQPYEEQDIDTLKINRRYITRKDLRNVWKPESKPVN